VHSQMASRAVGMRQGSGTAGTARPRWGVEGRGRGGRRRARSAPVRGGAGARSVGGGRAKAVRESESERVSESERHAVV